MDVCVKYITNDILERMRKGVVQRVNDGDGVPTALADHKGKGGCDNNGLKQGKGKGKDDKGKGKGRGKTKGQNGVQPR